MARTNLKTVSVYMPPELFDSLHVAAEREHRSLSNYLLYSALDRAEHLYGIKVDHDEVTQKRRVPRTVKPRHKG